MDANINGLRSLLDWSLRRSASAARPVEGFLFFSSSEIYGDPTPENIPTPETYRGNVSCTGPRACYDESKRYGETLCVNFAHQYGLPVQIARPFNNYGPGLKITDRRVIPDFARDILDGRDIVMLSDGSATRTFCYVADAVDGLLQGAGPRPRRRGLQHRRRGARDLDGASWPSGSSTLGRDALRLRGQRRPRDERGTRLPRRQPEPPLPGHREGPRAPRLRADGRPRRRAAALAASGTRRTARRRTPDAGLDHRHRLRRPRHRRLPGRARVTTSPCVDVDEERSSTVAARAGADPRGRARRAARSATSASASARRPTSPRPSRAPT